MKNSAESDNKSVNTIADINLENLVDRKKVNKFKKVLLESLYNKNSKVFNEISHEENFEHLKESLQLKKNYNYNQEDWIACLYKTFLLFSSNDFAEKEYSRKVLSWLAEKGIEQIITEKDELEMIHLLAKQNNLDAIEWAFDKYYNINDLQKIFEIKDKYGKDIFNYAVDGIEIQEELGYQAS